MKIEDLYGSFDVMVFNKFYELYKDNLKFVDILKENGLDFKFYEEDGGHEWDFWDRNIKRVIDWLPLDADKNGINSGNVKIDK